jgi:hypothetical protein
MREIQFPDLRRMSSGALRALLKVDSWNADSVDNLSVDTVERIHDVAAEREDEQKDHEASLALLRDVARVLAPGC